MSFTHHVHNSAFRFFSLKAHHLIFALGVALITMPIASRGKEVLACCETSTPKSGKTTQYFRGSTCLEVEKAAQNTTTTILNCTNFTAAVIRPVAYADASVLLSSPQKTSGSVIALSAIGPVGQIPDYLLILNVADEGSFIHVIRMGTSGFIEIADVSPPSIIPQPNQLLAVNAVKAGGIPAYAFNDIDTELPSSSDFTVSYVTLETNGVIAASERLHVNILSLTFAPLSPAVEIIGMRLNGSVPEVSFRSVLSWNYQLFYKTNLVAGQWGPVVGTGGSALGNGGMLNLTDPNSNSPTSLERFYKVVVTP